MEITTRASVNTEKHPKIPILESQNLGNSIVKNRSG